MALTANISTKFSINYSITQELSTLINNLKLFRDKTFSEGEGANQINMFFDDKRPLAKDSAEELDFSDGSLHNKVGQAITMDKIKAIYIKNNLTDARLQIGAADTEQLPLFGTETDTEYIYPTEDWQKIVPTEDGIACSPECGKLKILYVDEGEGVVEGFLTYDIIVIGVDEP